MLLKNIYTFAFIYLLVDLKLHNEDLYIINIGQLFLKQNYRKLLVKIITFVYLQSISQIEFKFEWANYNLD